MAGNLISDVLETLKSPISCCGSLSHHLYTSHSAYVATDTESNGAKIDGF